MTHVSDVFDEEELAAIEDAKQTKQQYDEQQQEFLNKLRDEHEVDTVETEVELIDGIITGVKVTMNGEFTDRIADLESALKAADKRESVAEIPDAVDKASQLLADVTTEASLSKDFFYQVYTEFGVQVLSELLETVFKGVEREQKRERGAADGFRQQ